VASPKCGLSIILFDEIEKAAPSMNRLLLGVLDRGSLRLGDNASVNFEKTIIFMTSNLGAREMMREITPDFGFQAAGATATREEMKEKLQNIGLAAVRRRFSPEFVNRIDHVVTYEPLTAKSFAAITDHEIDRLQNHVDARMGHRAFVIDAPWSTRQWLMEKGTSSEYGARELKRTIHRHLTQPLASLVAKRQVAAGGRVRIDVSPAGDSLCLRAIGFGEPPMPAAPTVLLVDDNAELLRFMAHATTECRWDPLPARNVTEARKQFAKRETHAAILDIGVSEGAGLLLAAELRDVWPDARIVLTCDVEPSNEVLEICDDHDFELVKKPFLTSELLDFLRDRVIAVRSDI
ncbi:MAG: ATPase domain protein, partial [Bryobacterales bacterium]|nr:ATPase domain protein [Bryobacterales bacterium]